MELWTKLAEFATVESDDFVLRPFSFEDAKDFFEIANNPDNLSFIFPVQATFEESQRLLVHTFMKEPLGIWAIEDKKTHKMVGCIRLEAIKEEEKSAEIGYFLHKDYWGQGYMTHLLRELLFIAFYHCDFHKLTIIVHEENVASKRVAEKAGFKFLEAYKGSDRYTHKMRHYLKYEFLRRNYRL